MGPLLRRLASSWGEQPEVAAESDHCSRHTVEDSRFSPFLIPKPYIFKSINIKSLKLLYISTRVDVMQYNLGSIFRRDSTNHLTQMVSSVIRSVSAKYIWRTNLLILQSKTKHFHLNFFIIFNT